MTGDPFISDSHRGLCTKIKTKIKAVRCGGKLSVLIFTFVLLLVVVSETGFARVRQSGQPRKAVSAGKWAPGEIIVKFKKEAPEGAIGRMNQRRGAALISRSKKGGFRRLRIPDNEKVEQVMAFYKRDPNVEYVEPNYLASALVVPNDPYYSYQWNLDNPDTGGIHMQSAWDLNTDRKSTRLNSSHYS